MRNSGVDEDNELYEGRLRYQSTHVARTYDASRFTSPQGKLFHRIEANAVASLMPEIGGPVTILDLACGTGRFTAHAIANGNYVVGTDISMEQLRVAKERLQSDSLLLGLLRSDAEHLPLKTDAVDLVISIRFLGFLPLRFRTAVSVEINRVTAKWAVVGIPNAFSVSLITRALRKLRGSSQSYYPSYPWVLRSKLKEAGFEIVRKRTPLLLPPSHFPKYSLWLIRLINWIGNHSILGYMSEQYFLLLRKNRKEAD